jgi:DNA-binding GntR family transcriptional regulator
VTKWQQIADDLASGIASGEYPPGALLPSRRGLVKEYEVADGTSQRALEHLVAEGLVENVPNVGYRVTGQPAGAIEARVKRLEAGQAELRQRLDDAGL